MVGTKNIHIKNGARLTLAWLVFVFAIIVPFGNAAKAACCKCCSCSRSTAPVDDITWIAIDWIVLNTFFKVTQETNHYAFFDYIFWQLYLLPSMMEMAEQLSAVGMQQMMMVGTLLDAQEQLQAQRLLEQYQAKIHKDYHPSEGICEFGSRVLGIAASERRGELDSLVLSQRSVDRVLGNANTSGSGGIHSDMNSRVMKFREKYCDKKDNNAALSGFCVTSSTSGARERYNKDVNYTKTVMYPWTIEADFGDTALTQAEDEVISLSNNLYSTSTFERVSPTAIGNDAKDNISGLQEAYLGMRSVAAKQSVAENSFNALMAMKQEGTDGGKLSMQLFLFDALGINPIFVPELLTDNPSYNARMELLTKKIYQNPNFYTNLYDKPANVTRKAAAIEAIGMIQKFDMLKSYLRTEASLSIILEISILELQREVEEVILSMDSGTNKEL